MKHATVWRVLPVVGCALVFALFALAHEPAQSVEAPSVESVETETPTVVLVDDAIAETDLLLMGELSSLSQNCIKCPTILGECDGSPGNKPCGGTPDCRCSTCGGEFDCHPCPQPPCQ